MQGRHPSSSLLSLLQYCGRPSDAAVDACRVARRKSLRPAGCARRVCCTVLLLLLLLYKISFVKQPTLLGIGSRAPRPHLNPSRAAHSGAFQGAPSPFVPENKVLPATGDTRGVRGVSGGPAPLTIEDRVHQIGPVTAGHRQSRQGAVHNDFDAAVAGHRRAQAALCVAAASASHIPNPPAGCHGPPSAQ